MAMSYRVARTRALLGWTGKAAELGADTRSRRCYRTKPGAAHRWRQKGDGEGASDLLREFPQPKSLLHDTLSRALRLTDTSRYIRYSCSDGDMKRATVTLQWPVMFEVEGFASRKMDAERRAAAAACQKLRELGLLGNGRSVKRLDWREDDEEEALVTQALSMFPKPKALLNHVLQAASSSSASSSSAAQELLRYQCSGVKVKECELTLLWPEVVTFRGRGRRRAEAESAAAALACLRLKELNLLDEQNKPLSHARYHRQEVRAAAERERRPCGVQLQQELQERLQELLRQHPPEAELERLWEEHRESSTVSGGDDADEAEQVMDVITNKPYHPLCHEEEERVNSRLLGLWQRAGPLQGAELPVDAHEEAVLEAVSHAQVLVLSGETGCGKTTRIPRFLLEEGVMEGHGAQCNVLVTQPRRISAVSVAQRVAQELGPALRHCVGYQVRLESRPPERRGGALLFVTVGVLLRKLQGNSSLRGVSHLLVDEVHERDVHTDLLLALLRPVLRLNPRLRLLLMSASGDTQRLRTYFSRCASLHVPGLMHPVRQHFLPQLLRDMRRPRPPPEVDDGDATPDLDLVADVIQHVHRRGEPGAVLCFLPGWQEIKCVQQKLEERDDSDSLLILPLHSSMAVWDQQAVFQRPPQHQRKVVLATNIAETSITIDDIVHVVDTGCQKEQSYDPKTKVSVLNTVWISRANVTQRRGRAGRCQPGHAYHLFPPERLDAMSAFPVPEIQRTPLESVVMQAKIHSPHCRAADFLSQVLDPPDPQTVGVAVKSLMEIGVLDASERLTPLGQKVACMSCDPRLGKVLVLSAVFGCVLPVLSAVACLTRDPFLNSQQNRPLVSEAKKRLSGSSCSDYVMFGRVLQGWRESLDHHSKQHFLETFSLSGSSIKFIHGLMQQFSEGLCEAGLARDVGECLRASSALNRHSEDEQLVKAVMAAGLYPNLIQVKRGTVTKGGSFRPENLSYRSESGAVLIHRSSVNRGERQLSSRWLTFFSAVKSNAQVFVRDSSVVPPLALLLLTDLDVTQRAVGEGVEVTLGGRDLIRWLLPPHTWQLLWALRTSLQTLVQQKLVGGVEGPADERLQLILLDLLKLH